MKRFRPLVVLCFLLGATAGLQAQSDRITPVQQAQVINKLADLIKDKYVFPPRALEAGTFLRSQLAKGVYAKLDKTEDFCNRVTTDLQSVTHDKHLRVGEKPQPVRTQGPEDALQELHQLGQDAANNFGFAKVERLPGNVGYVELTGFAPAESAGATAVADMDFLANSDALIIDLRHNHGGEPSMIQLISSFLFREPTHLNDLYWREGERTVQFWTLPYVPGKNMAGTPVYLLTSSGTFSAAEEFANDLKVLKRATVIGETTGGGANPGSFFDLGSGLQVFIPTGRAVNPLTGTNWEGVGVEPDQKVSARFALHVAYKTALQKILAITKDAQQKTDIAWALVEVESHLTPIHLTATQLQLIPGDYGPYHIDGEHGGLYLRAGDGGGIKLLALTPEIFSIEGIDGLRLQFKTDGGKSRLTELFPAGPGMEFPRD